MPRKPRKPKKATELTNDDVLQLLYPKRIAEEAKKTALESRKKATKKEPT
jgi:hypothetical protein